MIKFKYDEAALQRPDTGSSSTTTATGRLREFFGDEEQTPVLQVVPDFQKDRGNGLEGGKEVSSVDDFNHAIRITQEIRSLALSKLTAADALDAAGIKMPENEGELVGVNEKQYVEVCNKYQLKQYKGILNHIGYIGSRFNNALSSLQHIGYLKTGTIHHGRTSEGKYIVAVQFKTTEQVYDRVVEPNGESVLKRNEEIKEKDIKVNYKIGIFSYVGLCNLWTRLTQKIVEGFKSIDSTLPQGVRPAIKSRGQEFIETIDEH